MPAGTLPLPITETFAPADQNDLIAAVADCFANETAVYPIGGDTSLDFGLPAKREGVGLSLAGLNKVVDFPARDLTITVASGITMRALSDTLARENLMLPVDVPRADKATLGGVIATNFNGPRRYGYGAIRDHVIGVAAVDGRGRLFHGGGRVVKNVAGYDFCKLLTGSLGTLGVITEVTLKLKPRPQKSALLAAAVRSLDEAETLLAGLVTSETTPVAVELVAGPEWSDDAVIGPLLHREKATKGRLALAVGLEGSPAEINWMIDTLGREWNRLNVEHYAAVVDDDATRLWNRLAEFPQARPSPLVLKASLVPSHVTRFIAAAQEVDPNGSIQAHAGSGIVIVRMPEFPESGLSQTLIRKLAPAASRAQGNVIVLSNPEGAEMTRQSVWGSGGAAFALMSEVKRQFDPKNILNPDRFVCVY